MFERIERAQTMTLYCGIMRKYRIDSDLAYKAIQLQHITRGAFQGYFKSVFGKDIPKDIVEKLEIAQKVRDKVMHGKNVKPSEMRNAIGDIIEFAEMYNAFIYNEAGFKPFGRLQGVLGGLSGKLDKQSSRLILKGLGFDLR